MFSVGVLGAGAFGTALGIMLAGKGFRVRLWAHTAEVAEQINTRHENLEYFPGFPIPPSVRASREMAWALDGAELVLLVVPSQFVRSVATQAAPLLSAGPPIVCAAKGIEATTCLTMDEVLGEVLPSALHPQLAFLSGPSFAKEIAHELPTAVSIAARDEAVATRVQQLFATPFFRTYHTDDVVGVEVGGASKNVIAIAAGISDGLGLGLNTRAALITRGLVEITRLAVAKGAHPMTLTGLAGLGDLILTCTGELSRNHTFGVRIGRGMTMAGALAQSRAVVEGVENAKSVKALATRLGVEMPICEQVFLMLYRGKSPRQGLIDLMARGLKSENVPFVEAR